MSGDAAGSKEDEPMMLAVIRDDIALLRKEINQVFGDRGVIATSILGDQHVIGRQRAAEYESTIIERQPRRSKALQPDPRLVKRIMELRKLRSSFFDGHLFADPAWDMILDLTVARAEYRQISVTSLCIASGVPPTTALRWINAMVEEGIFRRSNDDCDK